MKTIDEVLTDAAEGLKAQGARNMADREPAPTRRMPIKPVIAMPVVALVVLALFGIPAMLMTTEPTSPIGATSDEPSGSVPPPTVTTEPTDSTDTTVTTPDDPAQLGPRVLSLSTLSMADPQAPDWPDQSQTVDETLAATGVAYDDYPDEIPDAATRDGRAVIVGGNAGRVAGIWYSDEGAWTEATVNLPSWIQIGGSDGEYRLADGIQNVEVFSGGFIAWEPVQVREDGEPDFVGTLVLLSTDGSEWETNIYGEPNVWFTYFAEYADGYLATISIFENGHYTSKLLWTNDLWSDNPINWDTVGTIGDGFAHEMVVDGSSVYVLLENTESGETKVAKVDLG